MRAGVDIDIAGAGGSVTHVAGVGGNDQKFSGSGMKKTVRRRALLGTTLKMCDKSPSVQTLIFLTSEYFTCCSELGHIAFHSVHH